MTKSITELVKFVVDFHEEIINRTKIPPEEIIRRVAKYGNIPQWQLKARIKTQDIADLRHAANYLLIKSGVSTIETGHMMGGRDHSTVIHSRNVITDYIKIYSVSDTTRQTDSNRTDYFATGNE